MDKRLISIFSPTGLISLYQKAGLYCFGKDNILFERRSQFLQFKVYALLNKISTLEESKNIPIINSVYHR